MNPGGSFARRLSRAFAKAGLLTVLSFACPVLGTAQDRVARPESAKGVDGQAVKVDKPFEEREALPPAASPLLPADLIAQEEKPAEASVNPPAPEGDDGAPASEGAGKAAEEKPFWAKFPPVTPFPKLGNPFIFPKGPGYYSLLDFLKDDFRQDPPKLPWASLSSIASSFFDVDFRYLDDPKNTTFDFFDPVKRMHPNDNWLLSIGGEERLQLKNENDSRLAGVNNSYTLLRSRLYGDLWYLDVFRIYAEFISANTSKQHLAPLAIDRNDADFLNLFVDMKMFDFNDKGAYVRIGRQELLYGSERLISPLDWANTRRTFEGVKGFWHGEKFDIDAFYVHPVLVSPTRFDFADYNRPFIGLWTTYKPKTGHFIDAYYLYLDQDTKVSAVIPAGGRGGQNVNTVGSRYFGQEDNFLWDVEGMIQFGHVQNHDISAGAATTGVGYHFAEQPLTPLVWLYYDYASGDDSGGTGGTFNQLFPFGHYYFGFIDAVGRQNIRDLNMQLSFNPVKWSTISLQGHFFYLDSSKDALYNAAGAAIRKDATGASGFHVGDELDLVGYFHLTRHQDILLGFSKLYAGEFLRKAPGSSQSPELYYLQYSFRW